MYNLSEAIEVVKNALKEDRDNNKFGYYEAWRDAIAKSITDELRNSGFHVFSNQIANNAAKNFLDTFLNT